MRQLAIAARQRWKRLGKAEWAFIVLLAVYVVLALLAASSPWVTAIQLALFIAGVWLAFKWFRRAMRRAIWRLRNRLLVTYLFIAVVPVLLVATLTGMGIYAMISQLAVYLPNAELDRRIRALRFIAEGLAQADPRERAGVASHLANIYREGFPGLQLSVLGPGSKIQLPSEAASPAPPPGWKDTTGIIIRGAAYYAWVHLLRSGTEITVMVPLTRAYLSSLVPGLGDVSLFQVSEERTKVTLKDKGQVRYMKASREPAPPPPPSANRFDIDVRWVSTRLVGNWDKPGVTDPVLLLVHTRPSAVLETIFNTKADELQGILPIALLVVAILFLIVEIIALVIGVSLTRTMTRAVHNLYAGTQRVIEGDFSHRITVHGRDQLATLSTSFNTMTQNLERLLLIAKEKERLQAELEIAREVQEQLYPKVVPTLRGLRLAAICEPARLVSGDYYDYQCVTDTKLALAIGDVAGKGISAALLMATIQSAMRMELRSSAMAAAPVGLPRIQLRLPPARLVSDLNQQLYATTTPEKYATFFFAVYDDETGELSYTNAGHLPPLLVRNGIAVALQVTGTVVGAFPFSKYEEATIQMETGDLLVCYTDGITEPENAYGEEFGEARLIEAVIKHADCDEPQIMRHVLEAVRQWTTATEQFDDMTLLIARKT